MLLYTRDLEEAFNRSLILYDAVGCDAGQVRIEEALRQHSPQPGFQEIWEIMRI